MVSRETLTSLKNLRLSKASIHEPRTQTDAPIKFTAGLILTIKLDAILHNIIDLKNIRVKVHFADQQTHLILPPLQDFRLIQGQDYRLNTNVLISHGNWSEPCLVQLSLVMDFRSHSSTCKMSISQSWASCKTSNASGMKQKPEESLIIELCNKPVQMLLAPSAQRRNLL